jgi:FkbM family methyltransferase
MYKKIQALSKRILRSFHRDYKNFISMISKHIKVLISHPKYYSREYLNVLKSLALVLISKKFTLERICRKINGLEFEFEFGIDIYMRKMYLGTFQTDIINTLLTYLKKGSIFVDVGANIGYITAIASGIVGKKGIVYSFEPIPKYYERLQKVALLNTKYNIKTYDFALGETKGLAEINIPKIKNIGHNTMVPGLLESQEIKETIKIDVRRLDNFILHENINKISLIKIDVEGFEIPVLRGLKKFFEQKKIDLPPIIVEITPRAYDLMGFSLEELEMYMKKYSYNAYTSDGKIKIDLKKLRDIRLIDILFINE